MDDMSMLIRETAILHSQDLLNLSKNSTSVIKRNQPLSDELIAFQIYAREIQQIQLLESDSRLARSIFNAVRSDGKEVQRLNRLESLAIEDRVLAERLNRGEILPRSTTGLPLTIIESDESEEESELKYVSPLRSSTKVRREILPSIPIQYFECVICGDRTKESETILVPCSHSHHYDIDCLKSLFLAATKDESLFPPRCDGTVIELSLISSHLSPNQITNFKAKSIEFSTAKRLYCSTQTCSRFLGAMSTVKSQVRCGRCNQSSCASCGSKWHGIFGACTGGNDSEAVEALKRDFEYQQCPKCRRMVELQVGCYHMTCFCHQEFCYLCAAPWKNCTCPQWNEQRLILAAQERVVAQELNQPVVAPQVHAIRVAQVMEDLREDHECAHVKWSYLRGENQCQVCNHHLREFILRCRNCMMMACVRCRRNRL